MATYRDSCIIEDLSSSDSDIDDGILRKKGTRWNVIHDSSSEDEFGNISAISVSENKLESSDFVIETSVIKNNDTSKNDTCELAFGNSSIVCDSDVVPESGDESESASNVENSIKSNSILQDSCHNAQGEPVVNTSIKNDSVVEDSYEKSQSESLNFSNGFDRVRRDSVDASESCKATQISLNAKNSVKNSSVLQDSCNESHIEPIVNSSIESGKVVQDTLGLSVQSYEDKSISVNSTSVSYSAKRNSEGMQEVGSKFQSKESLCIESSAVKGSLDGALHISEKDSLHDICHKHTSPNVKQKRDSLIVISSDESDNEGREQMFANPSSVHPVKQEKKHTVSSDIRSFLVEEKFQALSIKPDPTEVRRQLRNEIDMLEKDIAKLRSVMVNIDMSKLPDNGLKLKLKFQENHALLKKKIKEYAELPPSSENETGQDEKENRIPPIVQRLPLGFGAKALETQVREKTLTEEALHSLHGSINSCPGENVMAEDPAGLKSSVSLMPHQKHAIAWMMWRETQKPKAGILADDMGLGKTLTSISFVLKDMEEESKKKVESQKGRDRSENDDDDDDDDDDDSAGFPKGGTLVVCPASLMHQWEDEIRKFCKRGVLEVEIHHGNNREESPRSLARNDVVITTYSIVRTSANKGGKEPNVSRKRRGILHRIKWKRILLDEAHAVRNHKSQQSIAVCLLMGSRRWALTGTPIHNKELDLYALLKFLKVSPFDDYNVWRRWVDSKSSAGLKRLNTVINAIMLRRTKSILQAEGVDRKLPDKVMTEIEVKLGEAEYEVYTTVLLFSRTLFAQFLHQRAEKEQVELGGAFYNPDSSKNKQVDVNLFKNHPDLGKMFQKMTQMRDIKTHQILVLLLRLRQICCHPGLIKAMIDQGSKEIGGIEDEDGEDIDLLSQMNQMSLKESAGDGPNDNDVEEPEILNMKNPIFNLNRASSKINAVLSVIDEKIVNSSDKGVVVSQWSSMLDIIHTHLSKKGIKCSILTGSVPVKERMGIVRSLNDERSSVKILLLSLTAGGVGLNLTGANHLFLVDLHWNPQLESQAFDRIYRVGQTKDVIIYKFYCKETIEERIKILQLKKLSLAEDVLQGSMKRSVNKLTLDDLKSLFSM